MIRPSDIPRVIGALDQLKFKSKTQTEFRKMIGSDPKAIIRFTEESRHRGLPEQEAVILASDPDTIVTYMRIHKIREWKPAEDKLATIPSIALWYAATCIKAPFPKGEAAIATSPKGSFIYAQSVLHKRFPAGEDAIRRKPELWKEYAEEYGV